MKLGALLLPILLCQAPASALARAQTTYTLQRVVKAGDVDRYRTEMSVESESRRVQLTFVTAETVKEAKPDGSYSIATRVELAQAIVGDQTRELPVADLGFTTTFARNGDPVKTDGGARGPVNLANLLALTRANVAQETPVAVGDEVKYERTVGADRKQAIKGVVSIVGTEKSGQGVPVETLNLKHVADATVPGPDGGEQKLHIQATILVEPKSGRMVRSEGVVTGAVFPGLGAATIRYTVSRSAPDRAVPR